MHLVEVIADTMDSTFLVFSVSDGILDALVCDRGASATAVDDQKIFLTMESKNLTRRIAEAINHEGLESVGIVDDRSDTILILQTV